MKNEPLSFGIRWSMEYLDAYLVKETTKRLPFLPFADRPECLTETEEGVEITLWLLPGRFLKRPERLEKRLERCFGKRPPRGLIWYEDRLKRTLAAAKAAMPGSPANPFWTARFYGDQPFRENLIVLLPEVKEEETKDAFRLQTAWMEEFLGEGYARLNGLFLVSAALPRQAGILPLTESAAYYRRIYQDTGLLAAGAGFLPDYFRRKQPGRTLCVDARLSGKAPCRSLPEGSLYLDMASDSERERLLYARRRDVCYRSLGMYLDTFVRKRYNTNRCKSEEKNVVCRR